MKSVVITGSSRGLGLCLAKEFLGRGCRVTVSGRPGAALEAAKADLAPHRDGVLFVPCDIRNKADVESLWDAAKNRWGGIDIWINNAGRNCPYEYVHDTEQGYVDAVIDTNLKGMIYGSQVAAKRMLEQGGGQIWNMEGLGSNGMIEAKTVLYGTTKSALTYLTKGLAKELEGTPVTAGRLSPGMMLTDFILKTPDGDPSPVVEQKAFRGIFNILADRPETVAAYLVPRMLANRRNGAHLVWLTGGKAMARFASSLVRKRKLL